MVTMRSQEKHAREVVYERSSGRCEVCGQARASEWQHRKNRSQGGRWEAANGLHVCRLCHAYIHANPNEATDEGWTVRSWDSPHTRPCRTWHGYAVFDNQGGWLGLGWEKPIEEHAGWCFIWADGDECDCGGAA